MAKAVVMAGAAALLLTQAACTQETQRDTINGALIGGTVGLVAGAINGGGAREGFFRGAAIGAVGGLVRGTVEDIASGRVDTGLGTEGVAAQERAAADGGFDGGFSGGSAAPGAIFAAPQTARPAAVPADPGYAINPRNLPGYAGAT